MKTKLMLAACAASCALLGFCRETPITNGRLTSPLNAGGYTITNLPTPTASGDVATKSYVDLAGGVVPSVVTNIADGRVDAKVADWALKPNPRPETGSDTNAVHLTDVAWTNRVKSVNGKTGDVTVQEGVDTNTVKQIIIDDVTKTNGLYVASVSPTPPDEYLPLSVKLGEYVPGDGFLLRILDKDGNIITEENNYWNRGWRQSSYMFVIGGDTYTAVVRKDFDNTLGLATTNYVKDVISEMLPIYGGTMRPNRAGVLGEIKLDFEYDGNPYAKVRIDGGDETSITPSGITTPSLTLDGVNVGTTLAGKADTSSLANYLALKGGGTLEPNNELGIDSISFVFDSETPYISVAHGSDSTSISSEAIAIKGVDVMDEISSKLSSSVADSTSVYSTNILALARAGSGSIATNVVADKVGGISNKLEYIEGYMAGQRVRISVTNYYGNTSGELPRLRIEEYITATNVVDGVDVETNYWQMVWDENNKYQQFYTNTTIAISGMTNDLYQTYYALLQERLNTKAPRAWGTLTSAGEAAPAGTVWHTEPNTVFAGGTEYAHAMVGSGVIGVLTSRGAAIYTDGETGRFHFTTDDRQYYFGMNVASRYELGCDTDGITVTQVASNNIVQLLYNVTMSGKPILYYKPTLTNAWSQITDSTGAAVPGAPVYASWDQAPPAGSEICTINGGRSLSGFFKAGIEYAGSSKFETNMMADLAGGVLATNQTTNQMQPIEPYISNGQVLWRIKQ